MLKSIKITILSLTTPLLLCSAPTTSEQALHVAQNWRAKIAKPLNSNLSSEIDSVKTYMDENDNVSYHIVSMKPNGFLVIAGDDQIEPIIAIVPDGVYDKDINNPFFNIITLDMNTRTEYARAREKQSRSSSIDASLSQEDKAIAKAQTKWTSLEKDQTNTRRGSALNTLADVRVDYFITTKWNQKGTGDSGRTYNKFIPNYWHVGCTATAFAQLLNHFKHDAVPSTQSNHYWVDGSTKYGYLMGGDGEGSAYDWSLMQDGPMIHDLDSADAVGRLNYDASISVHMRYKSGSSAAWIHDAAIALVNRFGYTNARIAKNYRHGGFKQANRDTIINSNLDARIPVLMDVGGHTVFADGYGYDSDTIYHHINLGYAGYFNAWYNLPEFRGYKVVKEMMYNVYTTGLGEIISGRVVDNNSLAIQNAVVTARKDDGTVFTATTDDKGIYALVKLPSNTTFTITVSKNGYNFESKTESTLFSEEKNHQFEDVKVGNVWGVDFNGTTGSSTNNPPVANAGVDKTIALAYQILITGSATDDDGTVIGYEWSLDSEVIATTASFTYTPLSVGDKTLTLKVTDDDGDTHSDSMVLHVTDTPTPQIPKFSITPILYLLQ